MYSSVLLFSAIYRHILASLLRAKEMMAVIKEWCTFSVVIKQVAVNQIYIFYRNLPASNKIHRYFLQNDYVKYPSAAIVWKKSFNAVSATDMLQQKL